MIGQSNLSMDGRENLYSKIFLPEKPVSFPEFNRNPEAESVLRCKNYKSRTEDMDDNDIHNDLTDFVIRSAIMHKKLDRSAEAGTRLQSIRDTVKRNVECMSYSCMNGGASNIGFSDGSSYTRSGSCIVTNDPVAKQISNSLGINKDNTSIIENIAIKTLGIINDNKDAVRSISDTRDFMELDNKVKDFTKPQRNRYSSGLNIFDSITENRFDLTNKDMEGGRLEDSKQAPLNITNKHFNDNGKLTNIKDAIYSLNHLFNELEERNYELKGLKKQLLEPMKRITESFEDKVAADTVKEYINNYKTGITDHSQNVKQTFEKVSKISPKYGKLLENEMMKNIKDSIISHFPLQRNNVVSNNESSGFFNKVIKNWNNLPPEQTGVYRNLFDVMHNNTVVNESQYGTLTGGADVRINFKKLAPGSDTTVFEQYIPEVENADKIFYTNADGSVTGVELNHNENSKNILKDIYHAVYNGKDRSSLDIQTSSGTYLKKVPNTLELTSARDRFDLNVGRIVKDRLNDRPLVGGYQDETKEFYDMASGDRLNRDENGDIYVMDRSEKMYLTKNGEYTGNKKCQTAECSHKIYKCLLDDDSVGLEKCLDHYKKNGFNSNAEKEVESVHPLVALRTLQKFGFGRDSSFDQHAGMSVTKIESVDDWVNNFMKKQFTESQIKSIFNSPRNDLIMQYLNKLVKRVNSHPSLLNNGHIGGGQINKISKQDEKLTLNWSNTNTINRDNTLPPIESQELQAVKAQKDIKKLKETQQLNLETLKKMLFLDPKTHPIIHNTFGLIPPFLTHPFNVLTGVNVLTGGGVIENPFGTQTISNKINTVTMQHKTINTAQSSPSDIMGTTQLLALLNNEVMRLKGKGRVIEESDLNKLKQKLVDMGKLEEDILKSINKVREYAKCITLYGTEYKDETLSMELLDEMTKKCLENRQKYTKEVIKFLDLLEVLNSLDLHKTLTYLNPAMKNFNEFGFVKSPEQKKSENKPVVEPAQEPVQAPIQENVVEPIAVQTDADLQAGGNNSFELVNGSGGDNANLSKEDVYKVVQNMSNIDATLSEAGELSIVNQQLVKFITDKSVPINRMLVSNKTINEINRLKN